MNVEWPWLWKRMAVKINLAYLHIHLEKSRKESRTWHSVLQVESRSKHTAFFRFDNCQLSLISHLVRGNFLCCLSQARSYIQSIYIYNMYITHVLADHVCSSYYVWGFFRSYQQNYHLAVITFWSCLAQLVLRLHLSSWDMALHRSQQNLHFYSFKGVLEWWPTGLGRV